MAGQQLHGERHAVGGVQPGVLPGQHRSQQARATYACI